MTPINQRCGLRKRPANLEVHFMDIADQILNQYNSVMGRVYKSKRRLRFNRCSVSISSIAQQFYCEKALELSFEHPLPPTERMLQGEQGHESITSQAIPISKEESIKEAIKEKRVCIYEFGIGWEHNGIPIIGLVDEAWFEEGSAVLVVERKFSNSLRVYEPYQVQAQLYCLGLGEMGFNNTNILYKIAVHNRRCHNCQKIESHSCPVLSGNANTYKCDLGEAMISVFRFDKQKAISDLEWASDYWLGKREAIPSRNPAKCRACQYRGLCKFA
jgi:CRISPR/Cas system-associated exonuclease Cas4 (RecB family)